MAESSGYYIVVTETFLYEGIVYERGDLIPRINGQLDYCLGTGLVKIHEAESPSTRKTRNIFRLFGSKANP